MYIMRSVAMIVANQSLAGAEKSREWVEVIDEWAASFFREVNLNMELENTELFREQMKGVEVRLQVILFPPIHQLGRPENQVFSLSKNIVSRPKYPKKVDLI